MALYHLTVSQIRRSAGQSAIAAAAYRAGECLYSDYYGEYSDYTRKGGVICSEILLPPHAPLEYQDRATLWNTVEQVEKHKKAQLAYSFDIALQNELSMEENIALAREFVQRCLVDKGMVADFAVHAPDKEDGGIPNPHFHVMTTMRPINPDGTWGQKQRREYVLDDEGNRVLDRNGKPMFNAVPTTDWGSPETLEEWREAWCRMVNESMKVDSRYYCFGCGASGDVIDFAASLHGLGKRDAAVRLAEDFSIPYDGAIRTPAAKRTPPKPTPEQRLRQAEQHCFKVLCDYLHLLERWKIEYAPQPQDAAWHPLFVEALQKNSYVEYLLDILLFGEMEEKAALIAEQGKEVVRLEQRISELTASSAGSSYADDGRNGTGADAGRNPGNAGGDAERRREEQHQELSDSVPA